ncbi:MAG: hypothetical protein CL912_22675 [Deltaproteobacteria bacterium]|nr:hypothetical protein [Deltaproteobacteria bacterium]|tara:strand:- start:2279 stop:2611 length:333 start_codon:yes stop_codon:yes gene_type:complete
MMFCPISRPTSPSRLASLKTVAKIYNRELVNKLKLLGYFPSRKKALPSPDSADQIFETLLLVPETQPSSKYILLGSLESVSLVSRLDTPPLGKEKVQKVIRSTAISVSSV